MIQGGLNAHHPGYISQIALPFNSIVCNIADRAFTQNILTEWNVGCNHSTRKQNKIFATLPAKRPIHVSNLSCLIMTTVFSKYIPPCGAVGYLKSFQNCVNLRALVWKEEKLSTSDSESKTETKLNSFFGFFNFKLWRLYDWHVLETMSLINGWAEDGQRIYDLRTREVCRQHDRQKHNF